MDKKNTKGKKFLYLPLFTFIGISFGVIFDQLALGLCFGIAIGTSLDNKKNNKIK